MLILIYRYNLRNVSHLEKILRKDKGVTFDILLASYSSLRDG